MSNRGKYKRVKCVTPEATKNLARILIGDACFLLGVDESVIHSKSRVQDVVFVRQLVCWVLHRSLGMRLVAINELLGFTRFQVLNGVIVIEGLWISRNDVYCDKIGEVVHHTERIIWANGSRVSQELPEQKKVKGL